jgi:hypothetical protein
MYYPEANVLVPRGLDPASKTPAFKCVPIEVHAEAAVGPAPQRLVPVEQSARPAQPLKSC